MVRPSTLRAVVLSSTWIVVTIHVIVCAAHFRPVGTALRHLHCNRLPHSDSPAHSSPQPANCAECQTCAAPVPAEFSVEQRPAFALTISLAAFAETRPSERAALSLPPRPVARAAPPTSESIFCLNSSPNAPPSRVSTATTTSERRSLDSLRI